MKKLMFTLLLISCLFSLKAQDHGTDGNQFWLAYMENISLSFNGDPQFSVFVSSTESGNATITAPATGLTYSFEYAGNTVTEFVFPPGIFYAQGSEEIKNFGFRINTSTTASVFTAHYRVFFSEASIILPDDLLADEYLVTAVEDFDNALNSPSCLVIVATEDNSEIEITPSSTTAGLRPAGIPFTISLDAGQSYQVQAPNDLTGTKIQAMNGEKLAVFAGGVRADLYCEGGADNHLYDQLFPTSLAALSYVLIPFKEQGNSVFKILALEDNTEISVNETLVSTLQAQEFIELTEDSPKLLTSNKEVLVSQFNPSQSCNQSQLGDPTMLQLHSMHYRIQSTQFMNLSGFGASLGAFSRQCITLFTESENVNGIRLNDQDISAEFIAFPQYPQYQYATLTLPAGMAKLEAPNGVLAYAYGFGGFDAYSYALGFDANFAVATFEAPSQSAVAVFPNPTFNRLNIDASFLMDQIDLFDMGGRLLIAEKPRSDQFPLDLTDLPPGIYMLKIKSNGTTISKKVVKMR